MRSLTAFTITTAALLSLAGCTVTTSANFTISADALADEAALALQEQVGSPTAPNLDCGEGHVDLVVGVQVLCALSVDGDDTVYDATVQITRVDGTDYSFDVQVAEEPR